MSSFSSGSDAASGAAMGSAFGLPGAIAGGIAGGSLGLMSGGGGYGNPILLSGLKGFNTPLGNLTVSNRSVSYRPKFSSTQNQALTAENTGILSDARTLGQPYDVNNSFNNPFYQSTLSLLNHPIQQQQQTDLTSLNNQLNAQNQLGSSYDAYQHNLLNQRYDGLYQNAQNQARLNSANAYQQQFSNALSSLGALQNSHNATLQSAYMPATVGLNSF